MLILVVFDHVGSEVLLGVLVGPTGEVAHPEGHVLLLEAAVLVVDHGEADDQVVLVLLGVLVRVLVQLVRLAAVVHLQDFVGSFFDDAQVLHHI